MIPIDKLLHFLVGWLIVSSCIILLGSTTSIMVTGFILCAIAALGKEIWDSYGHGTPDKMDFVVTVLGGTMVILLNVVGEFLYAKAELWISAIMLGR